MKISTIKNMIEELEEEKTRQLNKIKDSLLDLNNLNNINIDKIDINYDNCQIGLFIVYNGFLKIEQLQTLKNFILLDNNIKEVGLIELIQIEEETRVIFNIILK